MTRIVMNRACYTGAPMSLVCKKKSHTLAISSVRRGSKKCLGSYLSVFLAKTSSWNFSQSTSSFQTMGTNYTTCWYTDLQSARGEAKSRSVKNVSL